MKASAAAPARHTAPAKQGAAEKERERIRQIVHDLNTPLSAVSLQLFLRRRSLAKPTQQELHFLDILDRNVVRVHALVAALLPAAAPASTPAQALQPGRPRRRVRSTW